MRTLLLATTVALTSTAAIADKTVVRGTAIVHETVYVDGQVVSSKDYLSNDEANIIINPNGVEGTFSTWTTDQPQNGVALSDSNNVGLKGTIDADGNLKITEEYHFSSDGLQKREVTGSGVESEYGNKITYAATSIDKIDEHTTIVEQTSFEGYKLD